MVTDSNYVRANSLATKQMLSTLYLTTVNIYFDQDAIPPFYCVSTLAASATVQSG